LRIVKRINANAIASQILAMKASKRKTTKTQTTEREERRRTIVNAASRLFADHGFSNCDMGRIARKLKIAKGTLYLYYPSKQALFFACVDDGMQRMQTTVREASESVEDPFARLAAAMRAYLDFFLQHPQYVELMLQERAIFRRRKAASYFEHRDAARVSWRAFYQKLIQEGRLRSDLSVDAILDTLGHLVYGTMFTNHFLGRTQPLVDQDRRMLDIVLRGILSDQERRRRD
jgi:AcrR family transcriptional regulator